MREPQHHAETEILVDDERAVLRVDQGLHLGDLQRQRLRIEQPIGDIAVERVHRAEAITRIGRVQILRHLPDDAAIRQYEGTMDVARDGDASCSPGGSVLAQLRQRDQPHGEIMVILPIALGRLADAETSRPAEHPFHLGNQFLGLVQPALLAGLAMKRNQ